MKTSSFYLTQSEIHKKFDILIPSINKVYFEYISESAFLLEIKTLREILFRYEIRKINEKIHRESLDQFESNIILKQAVRKFLEVAEINFEKIIEILLITNINFKKPTSSPNDFKLGSKSRIKLRNNLYIDLNSECEDDCLIFIDSENDLEYDYYTLLNMKTKEIIVSSLLDFEVLKIFKKYEPFLQEVSMRQNKLKRVIQWI